jgi:enediyne biosynthesis protein E4
MLREANLKLSYMLSQAIRFLYFFLIVAGLYNCNSGNKPKLFKNLSKEETGIDFENKLNYNDSLTVLDFEYMFNGAGVALCDVNRDGLTDVLFTGNMVSCRLYLNKGNMKFEDITEKAGLKTEGWCYGASVVDINQDGFQDIYICKAGNRKTSPDSMRNLFFINNGFSKSSPQGDDGLGEDSLLSTPWRGAGSEDSPLSTPWRGAGGEDSPLSTPWRGAGGEVTFTEKAAAMGLDDDGYDIQAAFLDYDHDGDLDMYLLRNSFVNYNRNTARLKEIDGGASSTDRLYRNDGISPSSPVGRGPGVRQLPSPPRGEGLGVRFTNVSKEAGITIEGFGLGVNICDINNDNWPDVYVSNDFLTNNLLWINNRNGTFTNMADKMFMHTTYNAMGNDVADFNNDGFEDVVEVDMLPPDNERRKLTMMGNTYESFQQGIGYGYQPQYVRNTLQLNNGISSSSKKIINPPSFSEDTGTQRTDEIKSGGITPLSTPWRGAGGEGGEFSFSEIGQLAGVSATEWSWAPLLADFDNDGFKDLFVSNGYRQDITNLDFIMYGKRALFVGTPEANRKERLDQLKKFPGIQVANYVFKNNGDLTFTNKSADWGMDQPTYSNGAAYGDLDNDGDLDLVINNLDQPASVYENQSDKINPDRKWLRINFKGPSGNIDGLGAKVFIWQDRNMQYQNFSPYRGYLSSVESFLHFGFNDKPADSLKVVWADGKVQLIKKPATNKLLTLLYSDAQSPGATQSLSSNDLLFTNCSEEVQIKYKHKEDEFVDFKVQPLLPHMLSREGPGISVSDVNADGLEDFFVGAAAGYKGNLFTQKKNGTFSQHEWADSNAADNMGTIFFDADVDGDNDLYIANGGSGIKKNGDPVYQHQLYVNNGQGDFTVAENALPGINTSGSAVVAADYDHDGDLDLFVGGRVSPGEYPLAPESFLLRNDYNQVNKEARFTNVTDKFCSELSKIGMVTSALWTDFNNDGWQDLIVVGEFMPITFIKNNNGKSFDSPFTIQHSQGWWKSIAAGDFDNDGDIDYMAGNLGLNGPYKASAKEPVCIYAKDYDKNGRLDPVMCHYQDGKEYTVHARDDMNKQITAMRARFRNYSSYAKVTFQEAFTPDEVRDAYVVRAETFASAFIENQGNGKFNMQNLPIEAQFAPVYGMVCKDFDGDGNLDVLCVGNSYSTEVQTGNYDAQGSLLLLGNGNGKGKFTTNRKEINTKGDNKAIAELISADGASLFLISSNSDSLKVYRMNENRQKTISINPGETYAIVTGRNGINYRQEFYYGSSYLSQSGRHLTISPNIQSAVIYNYSGKKREFKF